MSQSDETFDLIQSLTKSEKRFFRMQATITEGDKNYIRVFDILDAMKVYDVKLIRKKLTGKKMNLSYEKNYLQKQILRSMRNFHNDSSASELNNLQRGIELLMKKKQYALCLRLVKRTKEIALLYENYPVLFAVIEIEYKITFFTGDHKKAMAYRQEGLAQRLHALEICRLRAEADCINEEIFAIVGQKGVILNEQDKQFFLESRTRLEKLLKQNKGSFTLEAACLATICALSMYVGNPRKAYPYYERIIRIYEEHPHFIQDNLIKYLAHLTNFINRSIVCNDYEQALLLIEKKKKFVSTLNKTEEFLIEEISIYVPLLWLLGDIQEFKKGSAIVKEFEDKVKKTDSVRLNLITTIYIHAIRNLFGNNEFAHALKYANKIINSDQAKIQDDFLHFSYLFRLLIHYEMDNYELLENLIAAERRLFNSKWIFSPSGKTICNGLLQLIHADKQNDSLEIFRKMKNELTAISKAEDYRFNYQDVIWWCERKIKMPDKN